MFFQGPSMYSFEFENINQFNSANLSEGTYLWIWYADKIPPHIGVSIEGDYFSLKYNGKDVGLNYGKALQVIHSRKIPSVFLKVKGLISKHDVVEIFSSYSSAKVGKATCLTPLVFLFGFPDCNQLSDLLVCLENKKMIQKIMGINLPKGYKGIPSYGVEEIQNRLRSLEDAKIIKHISPIG